MPSTLSQDRALLAKAGIFFPDTFQHYAGDAAIQPSLLSTVNAGIPAFLSNIFDPKIIEYLLTPNKATELIEERGMGSWVMLTAQFPVMEYTGSVSSYGDFNNNGANGLNLNWIPRQQYIYQGFCEWGTHELETYALAKVDYANGVRMAKTVNFTKYQNKSYFFGVAGLQNYGLLNDPALFPAITPTTKTAGGTSWSKAQPQEIVQDIVNLYAQVVAQTGQNIEQDDDFTLGMSGLSASYYNNTNSFGLSAAEKIKAIFPKLKIVTAPEYTTATGELMQLIAKRLNGAEVAICAFSDKMRAFPVITKDSGFSQKFAAGTWGTILKQPVGIGQMLGI